MQEATPVIPATVSLPEITLKGLILGTFLTVLLAAANAYLGLKMGTTVSASIPAAVISMGVLRLFRQTNILENTMVQTMASVGEALTAGIAYILPALIILHAWTTFNYWQTALIGLLGGLLGVLFTIPLRRALLQDKTLRYPEATAIAQVLKASANAQGKDFKLLVKGGFISSAIVFCQTGLQVLADSLQVWAQTGRSLYGIGLGFSPALIAAGYIVGVNVSLSLFVGILVGWIFGMPVLSHVYGIPPATDLNSVAHSMWSDHIRYIGVGTMLLGGVWTLCTLFKPILNSMKISWQAIRNANASSKNGVLRTERDIPMNYVMVLTLILLGAIFMLIRYSLIPSNHGFTNLFANFISGFSTFYILIAGFAFCALSAYFAGLIGSSNSPLSGLCVSALLIFSLILLFFFAVHDTSNMTVATQMLGAVIAISCLVVMSSALSIANDTMQDLKVGQIVGVTPWKQQFMLILGVVASAFIIPFILQLLFNAYGIGGVFPHDGMDPSQMLAAPQAGLMAAIAKATFGHQVPWPMIITGAVVAVFCIAIDEYLKKYKNTRFPVLAVGLGIYLPLDSSVPVVLGGFLAALVQQRIRHSEEKEHRGLLLACGMVAGASLMGVFLAIPFAIEKSTDVLKILPAEFEAHANLAGLIVTFMMCAWMYRKIVK